MPFIRKPLPMNDRKQVKTVCPTVANAKPEPDPKYHALRDRQIVDWSRVVVACPKCDREQRRGSGTWATVRYARKENKPIYIVYPDGRVEFENEHLLLRRDAA